MGIVDKAKELTEQAAEKAKELTGQAADKVNELGHDELVATAIVRAAEKRERINKMLEEQGCTWRINGIEIENSIPPRTVFTLSQ